MNIVDVIYDEKRGSLKILCDRKGYEGSNDFYFGKKENSRDTELHEQIKLEYEDINKSSLWLYVNLNEVFTSCNVSESYWSIYMATTLENIPLKFNSSEKTTYAYFVPHQHSIFKVRPYIAKDKSLAFFIRPIEFVPVLKNLKQDANHFHLKIECTGADYDRLSKRQLSLSLLKRDQPSLYFYSNEINIAKEENISEMLYFSIPKDLLINDELLDVFIKAEIPKDNDNKLLSNQKEIYLKVNVDSSLIEVLLENNYNINEFYTLKANINSKSQLSFETIINNFSPTLIRVENTGDDLKFFMEVGEDSLAYNLHSNLSFVLKRRRVLGKEVEYYDEIALPIEFNEGQFISKMIKSNILSKSYLKGNDVWDAFIRLDKESNIIENEVKVNKGTSYSFSYFKTNSRCLKNSEAKFFVNGKSNLSLFISDRQTVGTRPIRIAVMGTCFSRNPFNSREYFNPGYKKIYECVYTQFHSSIVSLVSKPIAFNQEEFKDIKDQDINFVETDFKKDFFEKLKASQPDYLIIDLYSDAAKSLIQFSEHQYASASFIIEKSHFFKNLKNAVIINHNDNSKYFEVFKKALNDFIVKVTEILPESKIILNKGRFTYKYRDINGEIKFFGDQELIERNNYFWDKVDNYFENMLPNVNIIDLTNTPFIGDERYPFGKSFSHYESAYYKKFMDRLNSIVLEDIQTELKSKQ